MTALMTYCDWAAWISFALFLTCAVVFSAFAVVTLLRMIFGRF